MSDVNEQMAQRILHAALLEDRAQELLSCLFDGGSATVDPSGTLALATGEMLAAMFPDDRVETGREKTLREALEFTVDRARLGIERGDRVGAASWRLGLVSIEKHATGALADE